MILVKLYQSWVISFMLSEQTMRSVQSVRELESNTKIFQYFEEAGVKFRDDLIMNKVSAANSSISLKLPEKCNIELAYMLSKRL